MKTSLIVLMACLSAVSYRPGREWKTVTTDIYEISVQKNGRTDINLTSYEPIFANAHPIVWLDGEEKPRLMPIDGRYTERQAVNDGLGQGQGILFTKRNAEWMLRAYPPAQPYFVAQAAYTNTTKKPVRIKMLSPWTAGGLKPGSVTLGAGANDAVYLDNGGLADNQVKLHKLDGEISSTWNLTALNPSSGRSLIAGFLTHRKAFTQIRVKPDPKTPDTALEFHAECIYDPPVELAPGERLESEVLYIAIAEKDVFEGLERFGEKVAAFSGLKPSRHLLPNGWDSWNAKFETDINETNMSAALDFVDKNLKRYGWTHFALDAGWELGKGNWEPDPAKWPKGLRAWTDEVHRRGMTAGIWIDPFTINLNSPVAQQHPDWLLQVGGLGKTLVAEDERMLDVTKPEAYAYLRDLFKKIGNDWNFDALVEADFVYRILFAEGYAQSKLTHVEVFRVGMSAIREGFGDDKFITSMPPMAINNAFADSIRIGNDCAPVWRKLPDKWPWGCVETLTNAAQRYYFAPSLWTPDPDCAYFGHPGTKKRWGIENQPDLTWNQSIAWLTGAALTGGVVKVGDYFPDMTPEQTAALTRVTPNIPNPARPVDLFERQEPRIWSLPLRMPFGSWNVVAVFNWNEKEAEKIPLSFNQLGLPAATPYAVYDFWLDQYYGLAQDKLDVDTAPGSVHMLCLRPYEEHPMFLATDRHITMGASDFTDLKWDQQTRTLTGKFNGVENTDYNLRVLVPDGYKPSGVTCKPGKMLFLLDGQLLKLQFHNEKEGPVEWSARF